MDAGRIKLFCVNSVNNESWYDKGAHPRHRSYVQAMYDAYVAEEVAPFVHTSCGSPGIAITTTGASFGAYHAVNSLLKHPQLFRRCLALSGVYDLRRFMDGDYDDNFYFNNPVDYVQGLADGWYLEQLAQDDIRLVTGSGPFEDARPTLPALGRAVVAWHPPLGRRLGLAKAATTGRSGSARWTSTSPGCTDPRRTAPRSHASQSKHSADLAGSR